MTTALYPVEEAMAHARTLPGVDAQRAVPVLWPLWQVEVSAETYAQQPIGTVDRYVARAIDECGFTQIGELARFLSLPERQVAGCVRVLTRSGHLATGATGLSLTGPGRASLGEGVWQVPRKSRHTLLIEQQSGWPLPRAYYDAGVAVLDAPEASFTRLGNGAVFGPGVLTWLREHADPASFSLPGRLTALRQEAPAREGFLPGYLVHAADGQVLAYSALGVRRDEFLERLYATTASLRLAHGD